MLLLNHVGAPNPVLRAGQRLTEALTLRVLADHLTRRPLPLLRQAGFTVERSERSKAGIVERVQAVKPR